MIRNAISTHTGEVRAPHGKAPARLGRRRARRGSITRLKVRWRLCARVLTCSLCVILNAATPLVRGDEKEKRPAVLVGDLSADEDLIRDQQLSDARRITLRQANVFHFYFIERCMEVLPDEVRCRNGGLLATDRGQRVGQRVVAPMDDAIGAPLQWSVYRNGIGIFSVWISTKRTKQTLAKCAIEGQDIFLNVCFVSHFRNVDAKLPEFGGRSVQEVLRLIEPPPRNAVGNDGKK